MRFWILCALFIPFIFRNPDKTWKIQGRAQGTTYHITYYSPTEIVTQSAFDSMFLRLDSSFSLYRDNSIISRFNNSAEGVEVDRYFKDVYKASRSTWKQTDGLFDISVKPLLLSWGFGPGAADHQPDSLAIAQALQCVGTQKLKLNASFLHKTSPCVQIDMNGIAQGYTVDCAAKLLDKAGVKNYIVELGGEISVKGRKPDGTAFRVGIESPSDDPFAESLETQLHLTSGGLTTSGSYRQYREYNGKRYAHLLNPKTGWPVDNDLISVTVYANNALMADAYDNALMLMGLQKAMAFVEKRKDMAAYFIYRDINGQIRDTASTRFYPLLNP